MLETNCLPNFSLKISFFVATGGFVKNTEFCYYESNSRCSNSFLEMLGFCRHELGWRFFRVLVWNTWLLVTVENVPTFSQLSKTICFLFQGLLLKISSGVTLPNVEMLRSHATNIQWFHTSKCLLLTNTNVHVSVVLLKHWMPTFLPWRLGRQSPVKKSWNLESLGTFSAYRFCEE